MESLQAALERLDPRHAEIVERRFGLNNYEPHTLEEVGELMDITRERVRQIQQLAVHELRRLLVAQNRVFTSEERLVQRKLEGLEAVVQEFRQEHSAPALS